MSEIFGEKVTQDNYVGVFNNNSTAFDYSNQVLNGETITGIKVNWKNGIIVGLSFAFNCQPCEPILGSEYLNSNEDFLNLDQGDIIVEVFGRSSNFINCFGVRTKNNVSKVWGNPCKGTPFCFYNEGSFIKSFKVRASSYIEYIAPIFGHPDFKYSVNWPIQYNLSQTADLKEAPVDKDIVSFDDNKWVQEHPKSRLKKIFILHKEDIITGLQFFYDVEGKLSTPGKRNTKNSDHSKQVMILINEDEHLTTLNVSHSENIDYIYFKTDKGRVVEVGNSKKGTHAHYFIAPKGKHITSFSGEYNNDTFKRLKVHYNNID